MTSKYNGYSFPLRDSVTRKKVQFHNRYGIQLTGDLYLPKNFSGKLAAVAVAGPFGAVKEQCAGLYAEELASRGFAAMAFDPSFIGESGGGVRNVASPDIKHRGLFRSSGFSVCSVVYRPGTGGHSGNLRLGRNGSQRCRNGYPY